MKWAKRIAAIGVILIVVFVLVGFALPGSYKVARSTIVKSSSGAVFEPISDLTTWPEWTAWNKSRYPDMKVSFEGGPAQVGATYKWEGSTSGKGKLVLVGVDPEQGINYDLDFDDGQFLCTGSIKFVPEGDDLRVTWTMEGGLGWNPINRYFGLFMDGMMGPDFESGLKQLKARAEKRDQES
jgi:hypothetical protein